MSPEQIFNLLKENMKHSPAINSAIFNTLRILKKVNKGDTYLENYLYHYNKRGNTFLDYYHLLWTIGSIIKPRKIMEIGCRTGISICQLLSSIVDLKPEKVVLFDLFGDGFLSPELVKLNLNYLNIDTSKIEFVVGDSSKTVPEYKDTFDYILVDGNHERSAAKKDLDNVTSMFNPGGILIFDDIAPDGCNLIDVWESFKKEHDDFYFTENFDGKGVGIGVKK